MALSAFEDRSAPPGARALAATLGGAAAAWRRLRRDLEREHGTLAEEWKYPGPRYGWSTRLSRGGRALVYCTPQRGHFLAGVVMGGKAAAAALASDLPAAVRRSIEEAPVYAEGRGVRLEVRRVAEVEAVLRLVRFKLEAGTRQAGANTAGTKKPGAREARMP